MKTRNEDKADVAANTRCTSLQWRLIAIFLPIIIISSMLMSVSFIKQKIASNHLVSNSFIAGDIAVFVAMPFLNAAVK